jgi:hypothetical protein
MVPIAWNKRRFYNFRALNVNTFPAKVAFFFFNPQFPLPKYTISPSQMKNFPTQSGTFPKPKLYRSPSQIHDFPGRNEHIQEHHANQKFGWHQICQIHQFMALIYILYVKYMYFSTFFAIKKLPGTKSSSQKVIESDRVRYVIFHQWILRR